MLMIEEIKLRKIIRKKLIEAHFLKEAEDAEDKEAGADTAVVAPKKVDASSKPPAGMPTGTIVKDVSSAVALSAGTVGTLFAVGAIPLHAATAGAVTAAGGGITTAAVTAGVATMGAGGGAAAGAGAAVVAGLAAIPVAGWATLAVAAAGVGLYMIMTDHADSDAFVEACLSAPNNKTTADIEKFFADLTLKFTKTNPTLVPEGGFKHTYAPNLQIYVDKLYTATKGGFGWGAGTDEAAIKQVFSNTGLSDEKKMLTLMDVAKISEMFASQNRDAWSWDPNLYNVMLEELGNKDFAINVKNPLQKMAALRFGGKVYTYDQLKSMGENILELSGKVEKLDKSKTVKNGTTIIDPSKLNGNLVKRCQSVMNQYISKYTLSVAPIQVDGSWGNRTDILWQGVTKHTFEHHKIFVKESIGKSVIMSESPVQWKGTLSPALVRKFPGYSPDAGGCLLFLVDAYNGDTDYGTGGKKFTVAIGGYMGGSSKRTKQGGKTDRGTEDPSRKGNNSSRNNRSGDELSIITRMTKRKNLKTLESIGYESGTTSELAETIVGKIRSRNYTGGTLNLKVVANKAGEVLIVRKARGQRGKSFRALEAIPYAVKTFLKSRGTVEIEKLNKNKFGRYTFELEIRIPAGTY